MHRPNGTAGTALRSAPLWVAVLILQLHPAHAAEVHIASPEALAEALGHAAPGDVLLLEPGDYGAVTVKGGGGASGRPVTLRSTDPARPARIASLDLERAAFLAFEDMTFDYQFSPDDPPFLRVFRVADSHDIAFRRLQVDGDVAHSLSPEENGYGFAYAFGIEASQKITLEDCELFSFARGLVISQTRDVIVRRNDLHDLRSDGMDFAEVWNVVVSENYIHDFRSAPTSEDHADMIQFWTSATETPSRDITIQDNVLNAGQGHWTQSIFMRNEMVDTGSAGHEMYYRNVSIIGNVIMNAHLHGITVGETDGLIIARNTLVQDRKALTAPSDEPLWVPKIYVADSSRNVHIERNVVDSIHGPKDQDDWTVKDNFFIQNRTRSEGGFYGLVFSGALTGDPGNIATYVYRPGGPLSGAGIGAPRLQDSRPVLPGP